MPPQTLRQVIQSLSIPLYELRADLIKFSVFLVLQVRPLDLPSVFIAGPRYVLNKLFGMRERLITLRSQLSAGYEEYVRRYRRYGPTSSSVKNELLITDLRELCREIAVGIECLRSQIREPSLSSAKNFYDGEAEFVPLEFVFPRGRECVVDAIWDELDQKENTLRQRSKKMGNVAKLKLRSCLLM